MEALHVVLQLVKGDKTGEWYSGTDSDGERFYYERTTRNSIQLTVSYPDGTVYLCDDITEIVIAEMERNGKRNLTALFVQKLQAAVEKHHATYHHT